MVVSFRFAPGSELRYVPGDSTTYVTAWRSVFVLSRHGTVRSQSCSCPLNTI
jgi:hypothetical protein